MFARYPSLEGRVAFVTGGGSGIGAATVEALAEQGAKVAFVDILKEDSEALANGLAHLSQKPLFIHADLTDIASLRAAIERTHDELGPIGVLVNNAARDDRHDPAEVTPEYWDDALNVNLRHQFFAAQAVRPHMQELGGGSIINFSSIAWMMGGGQFIAYATAKAAVVGLTNSLGAAFGDDDIRVNAVAPGAVVTERQLRLWYTEADAERIADRQTLSKRLLPEEIARAVLFFASDDSRMITKQCLLVDAGLR